MISSILRDEPRPVTELKSDLPNHLAEAIRRCLEKDLERRLLFVAKRGLDPLLRLRHATLGDQLRRQPE